MESTTLNIKICGYRKAQRYSVERSVLTALNLIQGHYPEVQVNIEQISGLNEILKYTSVLLYPGIVINGKLVCTGRFPKYQEVYGWLEKAINEKQNGKSAKDEAGY
jgi:hypothetical protein